MLNFPRGTPATPTFAREAAVHLENPFPFPIVVIAAIFAMMALLGIVLTLIWIHNHVLKLHIKDPLAIPSDAVKSIHRELCGNKNIVTLNRFEHCYFVLNDPFAQERPAPPVLFQHRIFNLFGEDHRRGICYNPTSKSLRLRHVFEKWMIDSSALACINFIICEKVIGLCSKRRNRSIGSSISTSRSNFEENFTLEDVEGWVLEILLGVLVPDALQCEEPNIGVLNSTLGCALNSLFEAKEELCKMVFDFNFFTYCKLRLKPFRLMHRYNKAYKVAREELQSYGIESRMREPYTTDKIKSLFPSDAELTEEVYGVCIELLAMCKKKLGYCIFKAMIDIGGQPHWQERIRDCLITKPSDKHQLWLLSDQHRFAPLLGSVQESIRLNYRPYCCHLRTAKAPVPVGGTDESIKSNDIIHAVGKIPKYMEVDLKNSAGFHPEAWFANNNGNELDSKFLSHLLFGGGSRRCPGEDFAMTVLCAFIGHFIRAGRLALPGHPIDKNRKTCIYLVKHPNVSVNDAPIIGWN